MSPPGLLMYRLMSLSGSPTQEQLGADQVGDLIVDRRTDEDDVLLQQLRVEVVAALTAVGLLNDGGTR